jgi:hypothetical protein
MMMTGSGAFLLAMVEVRISSLAAAAAAAHSVLAGRLKASRAPGTCFPIVENCYLIVAC